MLSVRPLLAGRCWPPSVMLPDLAIASGPATGPGGPDPILSRPEITRAAPPREPRG